MTESKSKPIALTEEFTNQRGEPRVLLTWMPYEFREDEVYRIVHDPEVKKYVREVLRKNAMGEPTWEFAEAWFADNHNNSISSYRLCELIRFLIDGG